MINMHNIKIVEVSYGISSRYSDVIEINRKLKGELREKILKHELGHDFKSNYTRKDYLNDFQSKDPYFLQTVKFCIKNFEGWINYFPFMYSYYLKEWTFNKTALIPYFLWGLIFSGLTYLTLRVNLVNSFLTWTWIFVVINLFLLGYTHLYVKYKFQNYKQLFTILVANISVKIREIKQRIIGYFKRR